MIDYVSVIKSPQLTAEVKPGGLVRHPMTGDDVGTLDVYVNDLKTVRVYNNTDFFYAWVVEVIDAKFLQLACVALDIIFSSIATVDIFDKAETGSLRLICDNCPKELFRDIMLEEQGYVPL